MIPNPTPMAKKRFKMGLENSEKSRLVGWK
jgi:hypothetical protein